MSRIRGLIQSSFTRLSHFFVLSAFHAHWDFPSWGRYRHITIPACFNFRWVPENNNNKIITRLTTQLKQRMQVFPVTWQRWRSHYLICHSPKPHAAHRLHGFHYRTVVIADQSFTLQELGTHTLLPPRPWPWPDDLHIQTWCISPKDVPTDQKLTFYMKVYYVKAFKSCLYIRLTYIHTNKCRFAASLLR